MEITSFVLGMLTMVAAIIVTAIVLGIVKISKLTKEQDSLHQLCAAIEGDLRREIGNVHNDMSRENENIRRAIEDTNRDITMVERTIMNQIEKVDIEHHKQEEEIQRALQNEIEDTRRYIDSRIDKVVVKGTLESSKKQVING
jgi:hypothetical protein